MAITLPDDELVLGRGTVYFDPFTPGTRIGQGERYVGNTLSFQVKRDVKRQSRVVSIGGRRYEDFGVIVEESHNVSFVCESIDVDNLSDFFGVKISSDYLSTGFTSETFVVTRGRFYQLGRGVNPFGLRNTLVTAVRIGAVSLPATDWDADYTSGRLFIPLTSSITNGSTVTVEYETRDQQVSGARSASKEVWGALRFVADNAEGLNKNLFLPCVRLIARGAIDFKGDQWQQLPFEADASNLTPFVEQVYVDIVDPLPGKTVDEKWFDANPIFNFTGLEDVFDTSVNVDWPNALRTAEAVYLYDSINNIESPANAGLSLTGTFDLLVNGTDVYLGLNAPFARPDIVGATIIKAFRSTLDADRDYVLTKGGQRISIAADDLVLDDTMIWSVGP